ncbi:MAG: hypothetical protein JOY59_02155, partial [Candidatus Eremiobacteraeota bacterium]|nr:hypothetical protein [Candidatus Eremiobacteraeota bacterium]
ARLSTALGSVKKGIETLAVTKASQISAAQQTASLADAAAQSKRVAFDAQHETAELESV